MLQNQRQWRRCAIVKKQLALPEDSAITSESKFAVLGADSLDTVFDNYP